MCKDCRDQLDVAKMRREGPFRCEHCGGGMLLARGDDGETWYHCVEDCDGFRQLDFFEDRRSSWKTAPEPASLKRIDEVLEGLPWLDDGHANV